MTIDAAPVLLDLAKTGGNYQGRALRGYIRIARQFTMSEPQRVEMCKNAHGRGASAGRTQAGAGSAADAIPNLERLKLAVKAAQTPD